MLAGQDLVDQVRDQRQGRISVRAAQLARRTATDGAMQVEQPRGERPLPEVEGDHVPRVVDQGDQGWRLPTSRWASTSILG